MKRDWLELAVLLIVMSITFLIAFSLYIQYVR